MVKAGAGITLAIDIQLHVGCGLGASTSADCMLAVINHVDLPAAVVHQRIDEGRQGTFAFAMQLLAGAMLADGCIDGVMPALMPNLVTLQGDSALIDHKILAEQIMDAGAVN